ncbi:MAG: HlyC/CorC family transporter [Anaerolineae bacterium]|nr:HlyC/CorC family transporter [Anaerolineae bacterium]MCB9104976.1 HlyC/CorC family transporter [Anaerolineales bacterium]
MIEPDSTTLVVVVLLVFYAVIAAAKEAIAFTRKSRRLQLIEEGRSAAQIVDRLAENIPLLSTTEQFVLKLLGSSIVVLAVFAYVTPLSQSLSINTYLAAGIVTVVTALIVLIFGELIPKEIARSYAEPIALSTAYLINGLSFITAPLAKAVTKICRIVTGRGANTESYSLGTITEEDLRSYVDASEEEGVLKEEEKEMIYSIFDLGDTLAREVMVPRIDIVAVEADASVKTAMDTILQAGHSRVPVYEGTIDNIIGILYVKDLLIHWLKQGEPVSIRGLERSVYYVPETKPVTDLLRELQTKKVHIAIVVDEYGGTAGLVTIEDILEEIVGEIQDEHDADEFYMQYISDDEYIFSARMDLDDINDIMSIELPTDENDTLGGLIYGALGHIPKEGEVLDGASFGVPELVLTVLDVDGRRIKTARVKRIREEEEENQLAENPKTAKDQSGSTSTLMSNIHNTAT